MMLAVQHDSNVDVMMSDRFSSFCAAMIHNNPERGIVSIFRSLGIINFLMIIYCAAKKFEPLSLALTSAPAVRFQAAL